MVYLHLVYLTMLLLTQIPGWMIVGDELELWKEAVVAQKLTGRTKGNNEQFIKGNWSPCRDSRRVPPERKAEALPLEPLCPVRN
jgi:hypothetical protein